MLETIDHGPVRELRLARPPVNALDPGLISALRGAIEGAPGGGARALVLSGRPGMFSAGLDVPYLLNLDRAAITAAWEDFYGREMTQAYFLATAVQLGSPMDQEALTELITEIQPLVVFFDTQARMTVGVNENDPSEMGLIVDYLSRLREATAAAVVPIHHEPRNGELPRGASSIDGGADTMIRCNRNDNTIVLTNTKQKDAEPFNPIELRLQPHLDSAVLLDVAWQSPVDRVLQEMQLYQMDMTPEVARQYGIEGSTETLQQACDIHNQRRIR